MIIEASHIFNAMVEATSSNAMDLPEKENKNSTARLAAAMEA